MANLTALFGGSVKSVQSGTITLGSGASSGTATITAVNTAKAFVQNNGVLDSTSNATNVQLALTNSTTVTGLRANVSLTSIVAFTVVEFY